MATVESTLSLKSRRRRAYILIAVLGLSVLVTTLGMTYIEANMMALPEAMNRLYGARVQYVAESGIELGKRFLLRPPTTVAVGDYWRGGNGLAIDATNDYANVRVTAHATMKQRFTIQSSGVAKNENGEVKGKRMITAEVIVPPPPVWRFKEALLLKSAGILTAGVGISGSVHGNGDLTGLGSCNGDVSSSGVASWPGTGPPRSVTSLAPAKSMPQAVGSYYMNYRLNGILYSAYLFDRNTMNVSDATAINALDMTKTNPGRMIVVRAGNFRLMANAQINGTLIVSSGNLEVESGTRIAAVVGFPALVVSGNIVVQNDNSNNVFVGSILCGGGIDFNGKSMVQVTVNGTGIMQRVSTLSDPTSRLQYNWDSNRSWFYDFETAPTREPITVLSQLEE